MKKASKNTNTEPFGLKPPSDTHLEMAVLSSVMMESDALLNANVGSGFTADLFYKNEHQVIATAIIEMYQKSKSIDMITLIQYLKSTDKIEEAGGLVYITEITMASNSASHLEEHLMLLKELALRRNLILISLNGQQKAQREDNDIFQVYNDVQDQIDKGIMSVIKTEVKSVGDISAEIIEESKKVAVHGIKSGVESGFVLVDNMTNGWQKTDLIIIAGRPGAGKTSLAISFCLYPSIQKKEPIAVFSLEMSKEQLTSRILAGISEMNVGKIVRKQYGISEINHIEHSAKVLIDSPLYIDDTPSISLLELKTKARKLKREKGVRMIIIDYLQLMTSGLNIANREQEISTISRGLKSLAKELQIPIIALSQLSRSVESRGGDKKPLLSDLRESGAIEQDADMVIFCYRPEYYNIDSYEINGQEYNSHGLFMLLIAKHRNGELGEIPLKFIHAQTKITNHPDFTPSRGGNGNSNDYSNAEKSSEISKVGGISDFESNFDSKDDSVDIPF